MKQRFARGRVLAGLCLASVSIASGDVVLRGEGATAAAEPAIVVTKTVDRDVVLSHDIVRYRLSVKNVSSHDVRLVQIDDPLPKSFMYRRGSTVGSPEPYVESEFASHSGCPDLSLAGICPIAIFTVRETARWYVFESLAPGHSFTLEFEALARNEELLSTEPYLQFTSVPGVRYNAVSVSAGTDGAASSGEAAPVYVCGDLDGDHRIGLSDVDAVRAGRTHAAHDAILDLNNDGAVSGRDLAIIRECLRLTRAAA